MPRRVVFRSESVGDPQTLRQDDKDPMLTLNPDYLDCNSDPVCDLGKNNGLDSRKVSLFTSCINQKCIEFLLQLWFS